MEQELRYIREILFEVNMIIYRFYFHRMINYSDINGKDDGCCVIITIIVRTRKRLFLTSFVINYSSEEN